MLASAAQEEGASLADVLANNYVLAFVAALLGFLFSTLLEWLKHRRSPRKQLSWDLEVDSSLVEIESSMAGQVVVSYGGRPVENLTNVVYRVTNTGTSVIKDQYLRFAFPEQANVLEAYLDPVPEPELGVEDVTGAEKGARDRRWKIGHLEVGQTVSFRFLSDGGAWRGWTGVHPFNAEGGVDFQRRDVARAKADQEHIRPFFVYLVLLLVLPVVFDLPMIPAADVVQAIVALALIGLLVPHLVPVSRLVERTVVLLFERNDGVHANSLRDVDGNVVQAATITGGVTFTRQPE